MAAETHSFIDIAALEGVRQHFAAADAVIILNLDLDQVIWANGAGAALLGFSGIEAAIGADSGLGRATIRQIQAMPGFPEIGMRRGVSVRLASGIASQMTILQATTLVLPGGEPAILLASPFAGALSRDEAAVAKRAVGGFSEPGTYLALVGAEGEILAASNGFDALGVAAEILAPLVSEVARQPDRLLKRIVRASGRSLPIGIARLIDAPVRHIVITVDEAGDAVEAESLPTPIATDRTAATIAEQPITATIAGTAADPTQATFDLAPASDEMRHITTNADPDVELPVDASDMVVAASHEDQWYFGSHANDEQVTQISPQTTDEAMAVATTAEVEPPADFKHAVDLNAAPVRFVWRTDSDGRFSAISPEFAAIVGERAAAVVGERFNDVASRLGLDPDGDIAGLLERRDTWSGRSVLWPIAGTDLRAPVDLAALPAYGRDRQFEGFRGFGVLRVADAVVDPAATGVSLVAGDEAGAVDAGGASPEARSETMQAPETDPFQGEKPAIAIERRPERRSSDKVIRLAEHRVPANDKGLTPLERNAFREIGEQLRRTSESKAPDEAAEKPAVQASQPTEETVQLDRPDADAAVSTIEFARTGAPPSNVVSGDEVMTAPIDDQTPSRTVEATDASEWTPDSTQDLGLSVDEAPTGDESMGSEEAIDDLSIATVADQADPLEDLPEIVAIEQGTGSGSLGMDATIRSDGDAVESAVVATPSDALSEIDDDDDRPVVRTSRSLLDFATADDGAQHQEAAQEATEFADAANDDESPTASIIAEDPAPTEEAHDGAAPQSPTAPAILPAGFLPSAFASAEPAVPKPDTSILAQLPIPILIHAGDLLHYANPALLELTGHASLDDLAAAGGLDAIFAGPPDDRAQGDSRVMLKTTAGDEIPVTAFLRSVPWGGGKALMLALTRHPSVPAPTTVTIPDPELQARVAEMRTIIDTATDGVVLIAPDGIVRSISRPAEALFGFESDEVAGKPFTWLFATESQRAAHDYLIGLSDHGVASVLNDGREVVGRESQGRSIPLFMTIGRLPGNSGFCAVLRDITHWKSAEEDLTQARAQAERTSSQKTDFLARVSHEIRTPLNAIIGFSELMLDEKFGPVSNDRYRDYLRDINRSGNHVLDLVNDLLDISKIEAGQQEMDYQAVALNDTLAETVALMQPQANRERVIIRSSFSSKLPEVVADPRSVRQIALNILSNAVRYTQAGGQVIVSTAYEPNGEVVMRVRDTGIGMSQAEIEQALKPFKQLNSLKRARGDGTGLGLPLTKAMVEANRAKFAIHSTPGEGTLVEVAFPSTRVLAN